MPSALCRLSVYLNAPVANNLDPDQTAPTLFFCMLKIVINVSILHARDDQQIYAFFVAIEGLIHHNFIC